MAAELQMFLFLFKSKYRRKSNLVGCICCMIIISIYIVNVECHSNDCFNVFCNGNGKCINGTCVCFDGWQGSSCQFCGGKVR